MANNLKIATIVGARPQFIKAAVVSREIRKKHHEILIHTGQHYDHSMSQVFFDELDIPFPDYNLGIAGGTHAEMTGRMMIAIENKLMGLSPDCLIVFGDTNSTMAAALAGVKLHIPVIHIESGGRLGTLDNPEEVNRIVTDHVSTLNLACTHSALSHLHQEGLGPSAHFVGDPMYDAFLYYSKKSDHGSLNTLTDIVGNTFDLPNDYLYLTCHRQENTDNPHKLEIILETLDSLSIPVFYPVHPRNRRVVEALASEKRFDHIRFLDPVSYLTSIYLVTNASHIITDSGGVQREAFFAGVPCTTIFDYVVWPETMAGGWNVLAKPEANSILESICRTVNGQPDRSAFGEGQSAMLITSVIESKVLA